jgi:hypothetical protein
MQVVIHVQWLVRISSAPDAFGGLIENAWDREGKFHSALLELNCPGFHSSEGADERRKSFHWTARATGQDRSQCLPLFGAGLFAYDQAHGPITFD